MKAFIPAAGLGTRLQPLTSVLPKALVEIAGKPMLEWLMLNLLENGIDEVMVNLHHFPDKIREFFWLKNNFGIRIEFSDETGLLLDTGGGIWNASWFFDDDKPFLVHNADVLSDLHIADLSHHHSTSGSLATLLVQERNSSRQLLWDESLQLVGWENIETGEKKMVSPGREAVYRLAFNGIHMIDPKVFRIFEKKGGFSVIDVYLELASQWRISAFPFTGKYW
jgi:N-acetyl-alpha-D-muramate 1-phosphate uridylyltransferase